MTKYDHRLTSRVTNPVGLRLRQTALLRGLSMSALLTQVLDAALPSMRELTSQILGQSKEDHR